MRALEPNIYSRRAMFVEVRYYFLLVFVDFCVAVLCGEAMDCRLL